MSDRKRVILFSILVMTTAVLATTGIAFSLLYDAAFRENEARLVETAKREARLIEAIARFNRRASRLVDNENVAATTLSQMTDAHKRFAGFGKTGEFALARREGNSIVFLLSHRHFDLDDPQPVPFDTSRAEPMRRALLGESGVFVGPDYRGARVLAAYEPVGELNWGIVAKIDVVEIRAPFVRAGIVAGGGALLAILAAVTLSLRFSNPLLVAMEDREERYRELYEDAPIGYCAVAINGRIRMINRRGAQILGVDRDDLAGQRVLDLYADTPAGKGKAARLFEEFRSGKGFQDEEVEIKQSDGSSMWISLSVVPVRNAAGQVIESRSMFLDITERKQTQAALRESQQRLSSILQTALDAIVAVDGRLTIRLFNTSAERVFRCKADEVRGESFERFTSQGLRDLLLQSMRACEGGDAESCLTWAPEGLTARRADGDEFPLEATISRACRCGNRFISGLCPCGDGLYTIILRDVNDRVRAEERLRRLQLENVYLREEAAAVLDFEQIVGTSSVIRTVIENVKQVADSDTTVLVTGETGTGKELIARAIHNLSRRKDEVLVKVNCAALSAGLIESELFGHEKGAFTGALSRKLGRFELADGGTIFLDEIGDLPLELQAKLLRVLQEGEFERVGGSETLKVDARVIAATNRDLQRCVAEGQFRSDLYYRLSVFPIRVPPLRERRHDIPLLSEAFVLRYTSKAGKKIGKIPKATLNALMTYSWPGNVRELENVIERGVILATGDSLEVGEWVPKFSKAAAASRPHTLEELERQHIREVLEFTNGRVRGPNGAAAILDIKPTTLESRMKRLGITRTS